MKRTVPKRPPTPCDIRCTIRQMLHAREARWNKLLQGRRVNWTTLLGLHLQMAELECLIRSLDREGLL